MKKITIFMMSILALVTSIFGGYRAAQDNVTFIAHRGYSARYLENTAEAFAQAVKHGSGGIETDVRVTADGVLVCSHNDSIRLKDGTKMTIFDHTYQELTRQPLRNRQSRSTLYLCTFEQYLRICADNHMICFIEFKDTFSEENIRRAFTMVQEIYDLQRCPLQSFELDNLLLAHKLFPTLPLMLTCSEFDETAAQALALGFSIDMDYRGLTKEIVQQFHDAGLEVGAWTANLRREISYCLDLGVDYIESDRYAK